MDELLQCNRMFTHILPVAWNKCVSNRILINILVVEMEDDCPWGKKTFLAYCPGTFLCVALVLLFFTCVCDYITGLMLNSLYNMMTNEKSQEDLVPLLL